MTKTNVGEGPGELDWDVGPDFAAIAESIEHMEALGAEGWWGDTAYGVEQEEIMRSIAPLVGRVAGEMVEYDDSGPSPVAELLWRVGMVLEWFTVIGCDEDDALTVEVVAVRKAVEDLAQKVQRKDEAELLDWWNRVAGPKLHLPPPLPA
jgi:hypothetical protein